MSEYPKIIERPYKVFVGEAEEIEYLGEYGGAESTWERVISDISWRYVRSFRRSSDAEAYAERKSEEYEFVKIEQVESD